MQKKELESTYRTDCQGAAQQTLTRTAVAYSSDVFMVMVWVLEAVWADLALLLIFIEA